MKVARYFLGVTIVVLSANATHATSLKLPLACTIIADVDSGKMLLREGTCDQRFSPASSFKFPLAIMGFDSGILTGPHDPTWELKAEFNASERDQNYKHVDPASWEKDSIVWFSQQLTTKLGKERFAEYVTKFDYGNTDLSGDPGRSNGLTHAWLLSSLRISPDEQIRFLRRFMTGKLPVSARAITLTKATIASYSGSEGWAVHGKSGSGWLNDETGAVDKSKPQGWFVGWAEKNSRRVIFVRFLIDDGASDQPAGAKARESLLTEIGPLTRHR